MKLITHGPDLAAEVPGFSLADTFDCGQCFRWERREDGFRGVCLGRSLTVAQEGDRLWFRNTSREEFEERWVPYFDLEEDYAALNRTYSADPTLAEACRYAGGIRILRQEPWEALCSFIISQNNNIPRIKGIISRLCQNFGEPAGDDWAFPGPERLAELAVEELSPLRAGFRAKYILDAARKVAGGQVDLQIVSGLSLEDARRELQKIAGVGPKVAECALLYGFHRLDAFPVDTWIKKALARYYPEGFPAVPCAGVAQQYLFHYIRNIRTASGEPQ